MKNNGFILIDSLINVLIISLLCLICYEVHQSVKHYEEGYERYKEIISEEYENVYDNLEECEKCIEIEEEEEDL